MNKKVLFKKAKKKTFFVKLFSFESAQTEQELVQYILFGLFLVGVSFLLYRIDTPITTGISYFFVIAGTYSVAAGIGGCGL